MPLSLGGHSQKKLTTVSFIVTRGEGGLRLWRNQSFYENGTKNVSLRRAMGGFEPLYNSVTMTLTVVIFFCESPLTPIPQYQLWLGWGPRDSSLSDHQMSNTWMPWSGTTFTHFCNSPTKKKKEIGWSKLKDLALDHDPKCINGLRTS